jgi:hypothetical protein
VSVVVAIKPSSRKRNAKVGELVFEDGVRHTFRSREAAERWAADLSAGDGHVWVATAHPADGSPVDCYLVSRATNAKLEAAYDKRRRRARGERDVDQRSLEGMAGGRSRK